MASSMNRHEQFSLDDHKGGGIFNDDVEGARIALNVGWMCGLHASFWLLSVRLQRFCGFSHVERSGGVISVKNAACYIKAFDHR